jgi:hypothetical protein
MRVRSADEVKRIAAAVPNSARRCRIPRGGAEFRAAVTSSARRHRSCCGRHVGAHARQDSPPVNNRCSNF